ncbi:SET and MYND domain-containing protein 4-like protein [Dinothrombium tinctorium]|uniref:Protein-lysine N-methyltransferase SMYD4 n=1 Tax=Dinothrombium tinctorium TaxID=1965070 RepID=A0A3S3RLS2_9ACAR|nr:SET and MYND domain-containing protein 4-like protein [Dinothrombium tinctorium]
MGESTHETNAKHSDFGWIQFHEFIVNLQKKLALDCGQRRFNEFIAGLSEQHSNKERVQFSFENEPIIRSLQEIIASIIREFEYNVKNDERAKYLRVSGNDLFKKQAFEEAVKCYTHALMSASFPNSPNTESEMSLCFANRSTAFFHLKCYSAAIKDIDEAIKLGYSKSSVNKLIIRKFECLKHLKQYEEAKHLIHSSLTSCEENIKKDYEKCLKTLESLDVDIRQTTSDPNLSAHIDVNKYETFLMSDALKVNFSEKKGRHIKTTRDMEIGEIVVTERPYISILESSLFLSHCQHCLCSLELGGLPCFDCDQVLFCSQECRKAAKTYHKYECNYCQHLIDIIGVAYLVIRIIFATDIEDILKAATTDLDETSTENEICNNYQSIFRLLDHEKDHGSEEQIYYVLMSLFILITIENKKYVEKSNQPKLLYAILRHCQQLSTNLISIYAQEITNDMGNKISVKESSIGYGIYPNICLFNHSCEPNTVTFYNGSQITIRTSCEIKSGDELCFCYGPTVSKMSLNDRQKFLRKQYYFDCDCKGCNSRKEYKGRAFLCPYCKGALILNDDTSNHCLDCKKENIDLTENIKNVEESKRLAEEGKRLFEEENFDEAVVKFSLSNRINDKCLFRINDHLKQVKEDLCACIAMLQHYDVALKYCEQVLKIVKELHGEDSIEVANTMIKLISLKMNLLEEIRDENEAEAIQESKNLLKIIDSVIATFTRVSSQNANAPNNFDIYESELQWLNEKRNELFQCYL